MLPSAGDSHWWTMYKETCLTVCNGFQSELLLVIWGGLCLLRIQLPEEYIFGCSANWLKYLVSGSRRSVKAAWNSWHRTKIGSFWSSLCAYLCVCVLFQCVGCSNWQLRLHLAWSRSRGRQWQSFHSGGTHNFKCLCKMFSKMRKQFYHRHFLCGKNSFAHYQL